MLWHQFGMLAYALISDGDCRNRNRPAHDYGPRARRGNSQWVDQRN